MSASGVNVVRTYTPPPRWLLDLALANGLRVMVGLPWEQHIAFLDDPTRARQIEERVRQAARACAGHPAILCYAVGNEIPSSIVRWHGRRRIERFIRRIYDVAKSEDPEALVTYVNYPSTEYLRLPFLDLVCFNVFLEAEEQLEAYIARLQNIAGDRPLIVAELGLDSGQHGEEAQAASLAWQVRTAFRERLRGRRRLRVDGRVAHRRRGHRGLAVRADQPRPAAEAGATRQFATPSRTCRSRSVSSGRRASVIVCTYNGSATLRECLQGIGSSTIPTTRRSSSTTARRTRPRRSPRSTASA